MKLPDLGNWFRKKLEDQFGQPMTPQPVLAWSLVGNGAVSPGGPPPAGFGLRGMAERASLLGGTLQAGPDPDGGWSVDASLPHTVRAS